MSPTNPAPGPGSEAAATPARSPEQFIQDHLAALKTTAQHCLDDLGAYTQLHPHQTLLSALGAGYALRVLPTTRILGGVIHLALLMLKPAALIYGVSKLWHATQKSALPHDHRTAS